MLPKEPPKVSVLRRRNQDIMQSPSLFEYQTPQKKNMNMCTKIIKIG